MALKNLELVINKYKVKKKDLADKCDISQKSLTDRVRGKVKIDGGDKKIIYKYLVKNFGIKEDMDWLFEYSEPISIPKKESKFPIIKKRMNELNITNQDLMNKLGASKNTISNWRNGKGNIDSKYIIPLSKILQISPLELLGYKYFEGYEYISDEFNNIQIDLNKGYEDIYNSLFKTILIDDSKYKEKLEIRLINDVNIRQEIIQHYIQPLYERFKREMDVLFFKENRKTNSIHRSYTSNPNIKIKKGDK